MIRVVIERTIRSGAEAQYEHTQRELRFAALREHGYLTGETWRDLDDPCHYVVVSTWRSRAEWDAWATSEARRHVLERLVPVVVAERIRCYEPI